MTVITHSDTLPGLLIERAAVMPTVAALRYHHLGIWEQETWGSLAEQVRRAGNGLSVLGVREGDVVGIVSGNNPTWIVADLAAQGLGATTVAVDPSFSPGAVVTLLQTQGATTVVVGDQEQLDKVVESRNLLPLLARIVVVDTRGERRLDRRPAEEERDGITTWARVVALADGAPDVWTRRAATLDPDAAVTVEVHVDHAAVAPQVRATSTTSRQLLAAADDLRERLGAHAGDELHPVASFADPVERALSEALALRVGAVMNIGEGGALLTLEARDVQPTIAHVPARRLREIREDVERRRARRGLRRLALSRILDSGAARPAGSGTSRAATADVRVMQGLVALLAVTAFVVHRALAAQSGLLRLALVAAAALVIGTVLVLGGFAVRPFVRKAYGLARAHSLLTSPDIDTDTIRFLGALHLHPILERRGATAAAHVPGPPEDAR